MASFVTRALLSGQHAHDARNLEVRSASDANFTGISRLALHSCPCYCAMLSSISKFNLLVAIVVDNYLYIDGGEVAHRNDLTGSDYCI